MRIDEAGEGGGHDNACLTKPFLKRCRSYEDAGKGQGKSIAAERLKARPLCASLSVFCCSARIVKTVP